MSDRNDPKHSARPISDRNVADANQGQAAAHDPLAELARIVSGRSSPAAGGAQSRSRTVPAAANAAKLAQPDVVGDLEAELLSDLQASFSTIKETVAARPSAPPSAPTEPRAEQPAEAPPSVEPPVPSQPAQQPSTASEPLHELQAKLAATATMRAERVAPVPPAAAPSTGDEAPTTEPTDRAAAPSPQKQAAPQQPAPAAAQPSPASSERPIPTPASPTPASKRSAPVNDRPVRPPAPERPPRAAESERTGQPSPRTPPSSDRADIANMQLRPTMSATPPSSAAPSSAQAPVRQPHPRWDKPAEAQKPSVASRFAPPRAATPAPTEYEAVEDELFGDGEPFTGIVETDEPDDELPFGEFDMVPGYDDEDQLPPYPEEDLQTMVKRRSGRGPLIFAIVVALVLVGGLSFIVFRPGQGTISPPPIITADGSPTKITPTDTPAPAGDQNKLIYDRVAAGTPASDNTTLVTPSDQPVAQVPTADAGDADNPISRVIIPGGPGVDQPAASDTTSDGAATADAGQPSEPFGPRKVRTVVVRPDGTIVSSEANAPGSAADVQPPMADTTVAAAPEPAPTAVQPPATPTPPADTNNDTVAIAGPNGGVDANGELKITPNPAVPEAPDAGGQAMANASSAAPVQPTPAKPTAAPPSPNRAPSVVANRSGNEPIDITPATPTPAPRTPSPATSQTAALVANGGMLVQVSSQRSEDAARATFRDLQSRYPSILGPYEVNIQRASVGDRGIFYRARVGPFSPSDAQRLCSDLKAAGGDCILSRR